MKYFYKFIMCLAVLVLTACGGGGGSSGTVASGGTVPTPAPVAADFVFTLDKSSIISSTNDVATLTVTAVDANRNVLKDIPVAVSVDAGGIFTPAGSAITDSFGVFSGTISMGADKSSRVLKATISVSGITKTASVTVTGTSVTQADYIFELDKTTVDNTGLDKAVLTVTALDTSRNVLPGVPVSVSVDADGVFTRTSGTTTDANGRFVGNLTIGSNKSNRTINATITVAGISKIASFVVTGTTLDSTLVSATPSPGQSVTLTVTAKDKSGIAIPGAVISFGGTAGVTGSGTTDASGSFSRVFIAPSVPGNYTVNTTTLGVTSVRSLLVIDPASSGVPNAVGVASSVSLSPVPSTIAPNLPNSSTNKVRLNAKFITAANAGVENMRVRFEIVPPALGNGESISTGLGVVYSDASGTASADYIPGTRPSPTNGVIIRACYKASDFSSLSDCPAFVSVALTVAATPLSISISVDNKIASNGIAYIKQFLIQVNDAAGLAVKDAVVSLSVDITHFGKGTFGNPFPVLDTIKNVKNPGANSSVPDNTTIPSTTNVWCANEDVNRNGFLDATEDRNVNGFLEPRKAEIIVSYINGNRTDAGGQLLAQVTYGQNTGTWLAYILRATTGVDGSEGDAAKAFVTTVSEGDLSNGSFLKPPFGSGSCSSSN